MVDDGLIGATSADMMEKFLLSSIRDGMGKSLVAPPSGVHTDTDMPVT